MNKRNNKSYKNATDPIIGQPETCDEIINKYGTYEIQPTADSDNEFPEIAQALPEKDKKIGIDKYGKKYLK